MSDQDAVLRRVKELGPGPVNAAGFRFKTLVYLAGLTAGVRVPRAVSVPLPDNWLGLGNTSCAYLVPGVALLTMTTATDPRHYEGLAFMGVLSATTAKTPEEVDIASGVSRTVDLIHQRVIKSNGDLAELAISACNAFVYGRMPTSEGLTSNALTMGPDHMPPIEAWKEKKK